MDIELHLEGDEGQIAVGALQGALGDLLDLLAEASGVAGVDDQEWRVTGLRAASTHVAMEAPQGDAIASVVRDGLRALREAAAIPDGWTRRMVKRVIDLGRRSGTGGVTEVGLQLRSASLPSYVLDSVIVDHAERALGPATATYGSIRGRVDRWNEHSRREIGMSRPDGPSVSANYPPRLSSRILDEAVGHSIEAWGTIRRNPVGQITGMTIEDFSVLEDDLEPVSIASLAGIFAGDDSLTLDSWLRARHED